MAEFSKQYCERKLTDLPGDFDILEIADTITDGHYVHMICEGYGFFAIGKDEEGKVLLAFSEENNPTPSAIWKPYGEVIV